MRTMANVNVNFEQMDAVAKRLKGGQSVVEEKLLELKRDVDDLVNGGYVTDQSSKAFQASYQEFHEGISKTIAGLEGMSGFLTKAATTFRDSDDGLAAGLRG